MKLAIMQPYLFPYFGYFQLINAVDKFVVYDDVNFIKQGWINRNSVLLGEKAFLFTVPLKNQSSFLKINETNINDVLYPSWSRKFLRSVEQNYNKAPFFDQVFPLIKSVFETEDLHIATMATRSLKLVSAYLGIDTVFVDSSSNYGNHDLSSQYRVLDICKKEHATGYINLIGGIELYSKDDFKKQGIDLQFIKSGSIAYKQFTDTFVSNLSIIDILMFNEVSDVRKIINNYELI